MSVPGTHSTDPRVLVVTSDPQTERTVVELLTAGGFRTDACRTSHEAKARAAVGSPLVLVDLALADMDAVAFVRAVLASAPLHVLALAPRGDDERVIAVIRAGARGCVFVDDAVERLVCAAREVLAGGRPMSRGMGGVLFEHVRRSRRSSSTMEAVRPLTEREREVLQHLARGLVYEDVARVLGVSLNTVRSFVRTIYKKLDVNSRTEAVLAATRLGLVRGTPFPSKPTR